jgi:hypothetical protein
MLAACKNIIIIVLLLLLASCSSAEYKEALRAYESAKSSQNIQQLTAALSTLARLAPDEYQVEFVKTKKAKTLLEQAQDYQSQNNNYAAYLASHQSYRSIPSQAAKNILVSAGDKLYPLLQAIISIDHSFESRPKQLTKFFEQYSDLPVEEWDLIKVNTSVTQLSKALKELQKAHELLIPSDDSLDVELLQAAIEAQIIIISEARDYFSNLALYHSAKILKALNSELSNESSTLLSLVRTKFAKKTMEPSFLKANSHFLPFQELIENMSLAANLNKKDIHADWYQHWINIVNTTLEPNDNFENYPLKKNYRNKQLDVYLNKNRISIPILSQAYSDKSALYKNFPAIITLTEKLQLDKALLI